MNYSEILLAHGSGGVLTHDLIAETFLPALSNRYLDLLEDSAVFEIEGKRLCFTTDTYVVNPIFFPGGDIGSLAVHGTVNDLAACGGRPLVLSAGFILEEGFPLDDLKKIVASMSQASIRAGVPIAAGDTKVVPKGAADKVFINTSGVGIIEYSGRISVNSIRDGDAVILSGSIGDHGASILCKRENIRAASPILSDSAPLNSLVERVLLASHGVHCMRDATRGGLGGILWEIAQQVHLTISLDEKNIPVRDPVRGVCEMLGLDPLFIANEGKMVIFCDPDDAGAVIDAMRGHELGKDACLIGRVEDGPRPRVILTTIIGGQRVLDLPTGELVPRIC